MNPYLQQLINRLEARVVALETVRNLSFIEELKHNALSTIPTIGASVAASGISQSVRNSADTGSVSVAKVPDSKTPIILPDGTVKYVGTYNS